MFSIAALPQRAKNYLVPAVYYTRKLKSPTPSKFYPYVLSYTYHGSKEKIFIPFYSSSTTSSTWYITIGCYVLFRHRCGSVRVTFKRFTMNHPRHRLGVASLALDTSTQLVGRAAFEGILYSDGKDGLVMSWDKTESDVWPVDESRAG